MQKKPANKLYRREIHDFPLVVTRGVAIAEEHPVGYEFHNTVIADRNPVCIAGKVFDNVVDGRKCALRVDVPVVDIECVDKLLKSGRILKRL